MNDLEIRRYLKKITSSEVFARSSVYKRLLDYLTEATLRGEKPKETTIGIDVFNHSADDPSTSNIRVHIHKLRKNLAVYYGNEGKHDSICFSIPKGGYSIEFMDKKHESVKKQSKYVLFIMLTIIIAGLATNIYLITSKQTNYTKLKKTNFWHELLNKDKKTILVVGNYFIFRDIKKLKEENIVWNIRDIRINSDEDLQNFLSKNNNLTQSDYKALTDVAYMSFDVFRALPYIIPLLEENNVKYQIITSSDFNWNLFSDCNIVYIGSFKNLKSLSPIIEKLNITFNDEDYTLRCSDPDKPRIYTPYLTGENTFVDYALITKIPRSNNNAIYLFASAHGIGTIALVKHFTQLNSLKSFRNDIMKEDEYFYSIFKTEGLNRGIESFNMVNYKNINDTLTKNFWH